MHSHMRELTYSVVRNYQQKLATDRLRFCPGLARSFCDDKEKSLAAPAASPPQPSHHVMRREAKQQREENLKRVKEIVAENDR